MPPSMLSLLPPSAAFTPSPWQPDHVLHDVPVAPPQDTREAELAALAAQEKLGHDGKRQRVRPRRTVDPFGGLERWKVVSGPWRACPVLTVLVPHHQDQHRR